MAYSSTLISRVYTKEELCLMEQIPSACGIVIFGASGDLTHRKLIPALFQLACDNVLPVDCYIIGIGRRRLAEAEFQPSVQTSLGQAGTPQSRSDFAQRCTYMTGDYGDAQLYARLSRQLTESDRAGHIPCRHIFYLSTPPSLYESIVQQLGAARLGRPDEPNGWVRLVVEK